MKIYGYGRHNYKPGDPFYNQEKDHANQTTLEHMRTFGQLEGSKYFSKSYFFRYFEGCSSINNFRFALHWRKAQKEALPCMILFLVHETTNVARLVAQDQNGSTIAEVAGRSNHTCI